MKTNFSELEKEIQTILNTPQYNDHPASRALRQLWEVNQDQWNRMDRLTRLSDSYQDMMMQREKSLSERFDKHLRQLEKITRISDRYQRNLRQLNLELERTSLIDPLTELPNRRFIMKRLSYAVEHQDDASSEDLAIAMIDIDYFKKVNDQFGHQVGDDVLVALGKLMNNIINDHGLLGRWGGEEFLVILPQHSQEKAITLMEQVRDEVALYRLSSDHKTVSTSISVGISCFRAEDSMDTLLSRADDALYLAKSKGRNCLIVGS